MDEALRIRLRGGDPQTLRSVYLQHEPALLSRARAAGLADPKAAVQEAFARACAALADPNVCFEAALEDNFVQLLLHLAPHDAFDEALQATMTAEAEEALFCVDSQVADSPCEEHAPSQVWNELTEMLTQQLGTLPPAPPPNAPDVVHEAPMLSQFPDLFGTDTVQHAGVAPASVAPAAPAKAPKRCRVARVLGCVGLGLLGVLLVWVALGLLIRFSLIQKLPLGYDWFNAHLLPLF